MEVTILKDGEPLVIKKATFTYEVPRFDLSEEKIYSTDARIRTIVYTDGEIDYDYKDSNPDKVEKCHDFYFSNGERYDHGIDTVITKNLFLKDYTYAITYVIAEEWTRRGRICGWFSIIKEKNIYLKDKKDRKVLRVVKKAMNDISNQNSRIDYSSVFGNLMSSLSAKRGLDHFDEEDLERGIHRLIKTR